MKLEARAGIEPAIEVLQTSALPLGYLAALNRKIWNCGSPTRTASPIGAEGRFGEGEPNGELAPLSTGIGPL